jgi:nitrogen fixation-related uncharacterized protein
MVTPAKTPRSLDIPDDRIVRFDLWTTVAFTAVQVVAAALPDTFALVSVVVSLVLFLVGSLAFLWGFAVAIGRSQYEVVTLGGLFFLGEDTAPADIRRALRVLLAVQVVVAVVAASVRPFSELAFGILVPMLGLGLITLWAARHGRFAGKDEPAEPGSPRQ